MKLSVVIPVVLPSLAYGQNNGALSGLRNVLCSGITENCDDTDGCQLNTDSGECEFSSCTGMGEGLCQGETSCTWIGSNCSCDLNALTGCNSNIAHGFLDCNSDIDHDQLAACLNDAYTDELTIMKFNFRRGNQANPSFGVFGAGFKNLPALRDLTIEAIDSLKIIDLAGFSSLLSNDDFEINVKDCRAFEGVINIPTSISNTGTLLLLNAPEDGQNNGDLSGLRNTVESGQQCGGTVDSFCGVDAQCRDCAESGEGCAIQSGDPSDWKCTAPVSDGQKCGGTTTWGRDAACLQCSEDDSFCIPEDSFGTPDRDWICTEDTQDLVDPGGVCGGIAECEAGIECRRCAQVVIDGFTFDGVCVPSSADLTNDWTCTHPVVGEECHGEPDKPDKCKVELPNETFCTPVSSDEGSAWECQRPAPVDQSQPCGGTQFCNGAAIQCIGCSSQFQCQPHYQIGDQVWLCQPPPNNVSP